MLNILLESSITLYFLDHRVNGVKIVNTGNAVLYLPWEDYPIAKTRTL